MTEATTPPTFNPEQYKTTTREQWQEAAEAWHRWGPTLEEWLGDATERMLDVAGVTQGSRVLDIAAGAGGQTLAAAKRVGPGGYVLATDIAPAILEYAAAEARKAGLSNVETRPMDGEQLDLPDGSFDAVISRLGMIYFPHLQRSLAEIQRVLRPGGRLGTIVYSTADRNEFFSIPVSIIRRRAELPPPAPGQPGPFNLGGDGVLESTLSDAGFTGIETYKVAAPLSMASAAECLRFERESFGALHQMMASLDEASREEVWAEIAGELARSEGPSGFKGPCELIVGGAVR